MRATPAPSTPNKAAKAAAAPRSAKRTPATRTTATRPASKRALGKKPSSEAAARPVGKKAAKPTPEVAAPKSVNAAHNGHAKQKLVRDSFTMPSNDFGLIHTLKERTLAFRRPTKKSELLRAGLHALAALNDTRLRAVLEGLTPLKSGRPKKTA